MRIALVSPYSWTYPGGVTRHIEALAGEFEGRGHEVSILAPVDPVDRVSAAMHRGAWPQRRPVDPRVVDLGRTVGFPANGAISNLAVSPAGVVALRRELARGRFDVAHLHEPVAPLVGWDALGHARVPLVGTFHCYSENPISNGLGVLLGARRRLNHLRVRIAVSEAAEWTGRRFYGGRYRVIPNGVDVGPMGVDAGPLSRRVGSAAHTAAEQARGERDGALNVVFVGQAVERKGLPVLARAFEALREQVPGATLTVVGADDGEIAPMLMDPRGVVALGKVSDERKWAALREADVLCAPSLGGESFGMVLTEAFAAGTSVVASDIAGYAGVVEDDVDGHLFPRGDATALAERLHALALDSPARRRLAAAARASADRYAWPNVAEQVLESYDDAISIGEPQGARARIAVRYGLRPADLRPAARARRLPSLSPDASATTHAHAFARRAAFGLAGVAGLVLAALALSRIGIDQIVASLVASSPPWVLAGLGLMCVSMAMRGFAWHAILRAALPDRRVRRRDAMQGTFIGVLMSATLPARLGEPSRALIVARRVGRARETLPVVLGTIVSQTLLNIVALVVLGIVMFSSVDFFNGHHAALVAATIGPVAMIAAVLVAPSLLPSSTIGRSARLHALVTRVRGALARTREGLVVFRRPRLAATAIAAQLRARAVQWMACYALLVALGLDGRAGVGAAAAVLFAINVTAVLPATPSNLGVFQAACVAVLAGAYHVPSASALGYGIILQAVEIATAVVMGMPALVKEGLSWREVRLRALHAAPARTRLGGASAARRSGGAEAEA